METNYIDVPNDYEGRCVNIPSVSSYVTPPKELSRLKGNRYELKALVPRFRVEWSDELNDESQDLYGCDFHQFLELGAKLILTRVDGTAKKIMFGLNEKTGLYEGYTESNHITAQLHCDSYRLAEDPKVKEFKKMVFGLIKMGMLPPDADPQDETELRAMISEFNAK